MFELMTALKINESTWAFQAKWEQSTESLSTSLVLWPGVQITVFTNSHQMEDFQQPEYKAYTPVTTHQTQDHEDLLWLSHYKRRQKTETFLILSLPSTINCFNFFTDFLAFPYKLLLIFWEFGGSSSIKKLLSNSTTEEGKLHALSITLSVLKLYFFLFVWSCYSGTSIQQTSI